MKREEICKDIDHSVSLQDYRIFWGFPKGTAWEVMTPVEDGQEREKKWK